MPNGIKERIATLEANYQELRNDIREITDNHLVHLRTDIKELHDKFDKGVLAVLATLVGIIIDIALKFL